jgi:hypothetical protein
LHACLIPTKRTPSLKPKLQLVEKVSKMLVRTMISSDFMGEELGEALFGGKIPTE